MVVELIRYMWAKFFHVVIAFDRFMREPLWATYTDFFEAFLAVVLEFSLQEVLR